MKNHLLFNVKNCIYNLPAFQCDNAERVEPQKKVLYNTSKYMSCTCIYNTFNQTMYFPRKNNKKKRNRMWQHANNSVHDCHSIKTTKQNSSKQSTCVYACVSFLFVSNAYSPSVFP